jgi:hypothetical protein
MLSLFALTRLFFQALKQPIKIHVRPVLCAEGDAAKSNTRYISNMQHAICSAGRNSKGGW